MKHDVVVPSAGESVTEVFIGGWRKATGDFVKKNEVIVEIETQKATFELQAENSGRIEVLKPERDAVVHPGDVIAIIDDSVTQEASVGRGTPAAGVPLPAFKPSGPPVEPIMAPAARKIAAEKGVDAATLKGSGKGGRILKEDVMGVSPSAATARPVPTLAPVAHAPAIASPAAPHLYSAEIDALRGERRQPATRIRRQIAANLVMAQQTAAILTTFNEVDMTRLLEFRKRVKDEFKQKHGVGLGIVSIFAQAVVCTLREFPIVNSAFTGDEIVTRDFVDLSVAVSTERGLVTPVIRDCDKISLVEFETKLAELSEKARAGKLSIPDMAGGTFTISNGGVFGSLISTPILNMPQSAILGLHKTQDRPVVVDGQIVIRPMMYLALSYDHRLIDGREAVMFLVGVKNRIEQFDMKIP